jgi:uncharacterized membrane protein YfcA
LYGVQESSITPPGSSSEVRSDATEGKPQGAGSARENSAQKIQFDQDVDELKDHSALDAAGPMGPMGPMGATDPTLAATQSSSVFAEQEHHATIATSRAGALSRPARSVARTSSETPRETKLWVFVLWLVVWYAAWVSFVVVGEHLDAVQDNWPIALAMALGSYFAGSTPLGGGTVGFPFLVLFFEFPASAGRNFSFAVQSIGMVSATIYILASRTPLAWRTLGFALVGSLIATPLGAAFVAPAVPDSHAKLLFSVLWAGFGFFALSNVASLCATHHAPPPARNRPEVGYNARLGFGVGVVGGIIASITGVGIDMLVFVALMLLLRADVRVAIPTSVVLMAMTSVIGLLSNIALGSVEPTVWPQWLAASPVVAIGAPLGAIAVKIIPRHISMWVLGWLCLGQFVWMCGHERPSLPMLLFLGCAVASVVLAFRYAYSYARGDTST